MKILICILLLPIYSTSQTIYRGSIANSKTKQPISFATVALVGQNIGINADVQGNFILIDKLSQKIDTFQISCVGYVTRKVSISDTSFHSFELDERTTKLADIKIVSKEKWTKESLNYFSGNGNIGFSTSGASHSQVARLFNSPSNNTKLIEVGIRKNQPPFSEGKSIFRLRIYDMDTLTGGPSNDLCNEIIEINSSRRIIKIDLEKYKISVGKFFFVAIEWLKIPENENKGIVKVNGEMIESVSYRPIISASRVDDADEYDSAKTSVVWTLNYQNEWTNIWWCSDIYISATVAY